MQRSDFNWFLNNYNELFKKYGHKYLVIKDETVLGAYDTTRQALDNTDEKLGTFIIQECNGKESAYTNSVSSFIAWGLDYAVKFLRIYNNI